MGKRLSTIRVAALRAASEPRGISAAELAPRIGRTLDHTRGLLSDLVRAGHLHRAKIEGIVSRHFASAAAAEAWRLAQIQKPAKHWPMNLPGTPKDTRPLPKSAPQTRPCPNWTHDTRYQCAPGEQPYGAGFAAEWRRLRGEAA